MTEAEREYRVSVSAANGDGSENLLGFVWKPSDGEDAFQHRLRQIRWAVDATRSGAAREVKQ